MVLSVPLLRYFWSLLVVEADFSGFVDVLRTSITFGANPLD